MTSEKRFSLIARNYPSFQEINPLQLNAYKWMKSRQQDDNAEGLWRVHDTLYDLTDFINWHPGGTDWIRLTKGTDITEAFEVHHLNYAKAEYILQDYRVRDAKLPRNFKFTFKETGFYRTLRRRVADKLKTIDVKKAEFKSKVCIDVLLALTLITSVLSVKFYNRYLIAVAGAFMCYTVITAHNFFHRRDNHRMYYFNLSFYNYREWRISHAMSHHLYPNSIHDLEVTLFEPILCWIPSNMKSIFQRYVSWLYSPIVYAFICFDQIVKRIFFSFATKKNLFQTNDLVPLAVPVLMLALGNSNPFAVFTTWLQIILVCSFMFHLIGLNAGHHHPDLVHDGDKIRDDLDWGIYCIDTIMDNTDLRRHDILALTHFGHHALHHLFPTIDHWALHELYPLVLETMAEFEVELEGYPYYHHILGQLRQLSTTTKKTFDSLEKFNRKKIEKKLE